MGTLGEDIKAAREKKGLTLKQLSDKTRISQTFLKAIEDEEYSVIPGDVFVIGFIRTCARELGFKEKELIARYREQQKARMPVQQPVEKPAEPKAKDVAMKAGTLPAKKKWPLYLVLIAGLVAGGVIIAVSLYLTKPEKVSTQPPPPVAAPAPAPAVLSPMTTAKPALANRSTAKPAKAKPATPEIKHVSAWKLNLKLTAQDTSWYSYKADKGTWTSGLLDKGKALEINADERINLSLGSAGDVKVEYNGKTLKPFGEKGAVVKGIVFTGKLEGFVTPVKKAPENQEIPNR